MSDIAEKLQQAISDEESSAKREMSAPVGQTAEGLARLAGRLRRCAADREMLAAVQRYIDGHPGPCVNYEGQDPAHYSEFDSCALHIEWNKTTTLPPCVLEILARGYGLEV